MMFGLIRRVPPLSDVLTDESGLMVAELVEEALAGDEVRAAVEDNPDLYVDHLRQQAFAVTDEMLRAGAVEEETLRQRVEEAHKTTYLKRHAAGTEWVRDSATVAMVVLMMVSDGMAAFGAWHLANGVGGPLAAWVAAVVVFAGIGFMIFNIDAASVVRVSLAIAVLIAGPIASGYVQGGGLMAMAFGGLFLAAGIVIVVLLDAGVSPVRFVNGRARFAASKELVPLYEAWRLAVREAGVLTALRELINDSQQKRYSTELKVRTWPGLRHTGDLGYHVPTKARDDLVRCVDRVDGGSFALAGPRGAGKTILMLRFCEGAYSDEPGRDLGVVVSAPVEYDARDFVLHLYTELCNTVRDYVSRAGASTKTRRFRARVEGPLDSLLKTVEDNLSWIHYLKTVSTELSGKAGLGYAEIAAKTARSLAERPRTYPEIVASLRGFLRTLADTLHAWADAEGRTTPRVLIGIDELDRMGAGDRARLFLDDIKAIFWVRGCYFLVSVSEDALRSFELAGHGLRDVIDSAFDEVVPVDHLDFESSARLLRARVTGMSLPYYALAYCLSGGLPRELMRVARTIVEQCRSDREVLLGEVTAQLLSEDLARHCRAGRLVLADSGAEAAELIGRLDEGSAPGGEELRAFEKALTAAADGRSDLVRSVAGTASAHAVYLAALASVFVDGLSEDEVGRARFDALARARRYLGVNDTFARMLVDGFLNASV